MGRGTPKTGGRTTTAGGATGAPATGSQGGITMTGGSTTATGRSNYGPGNPSTTTPSVRTYHTGIEAMAEPSLAVNFQLGQRLAATPSRTYRPGSTGATATNGTTSTTPKNSPTCVVSTASRPPVRRRRRTPEATTATTPSSTLAIAPSRPSAQPADSSCGPANVDDRRACPDGGPGGRGRGSPGKPSKQRIHGRKNISAQNDEPRSV